MKQGRLPERTMIFCLTWPSGPSWFSTWRRSCQMAMRSTGWLRSGRVSIMPGPRAITLAVSRPVPRSNIVASMVRMYVTDVTLP